MIWDQGKASQSHKTIAQDFFFVVLTDVESSVSHKVGDMASYIFENKRRLKVKNQKKKSDVVFFVEKNWRFVISSVEYMIVFSARDFCGSHIRLF